MRPTVRPTPQILATAVLLAALVGCGGDGESDAGREPAPSSSPTDAPSQAPTEEPSGGPSAGPVPGQEGEGWRLVEIVHEAAAGGEAGGSVVRIDDPESLESFVGQFSRDGLAADLQRITADHEPAPGTGLVAAVVGLGCDVPTGVSYAEGVVTALKVPDPLPNCVAPVTSVAVLEVADPA